MASKNISAKRNAHGVLKAPSLKRRPLKAPSSNQAEGSLFHVEAEDSLSKDEVEEPLFQVNIPEQFDKKRADSSGSLESRLFQLIDKGTIKIADDCVVWIDEMGLPTRKGLTPLSCEDLKRPRPSFYAGKDADVTAFEDEIRSGRILWRQPTLKEDGEEKTATEASLFDLVLAELKSVPRITHLAWKDLRRDFKIASESGKPYSEQITAYRVRETIGREKNDFNLLTVFENAFKRLYGMESFLLHVPLTSIYLLAGVEPKGTDRDADLENMGNGLGRNVSEVVRLAKLLQRRATTRDRLVTGAERLGSVAAVLRAGEMAPLMNSHLASMGV